MQPLGSGFAHISDRIPSSLIARNSPGSTSRTNAAPTISRAADSDATTQPRSSFPITSGRTPWRSRAAYKVCSSINTSEKAPSSFGRTAIALASTFFSSCRPMSAVMISVSVVAPRSFFGTSTSSFWTNSARSPVLVRLPLWARARVPYFVGRRVGCALTHVLDPVVL
ncbi:unannotated protein [freshwater metagenome]|uniref:Unannotated protein n=1 Tax=freshwater metagenome TaxID=449393 RepID=A0A6J7PAS3_9ZZZZ